jgi:hypothetical protein
MTACEVVIERELLLQQAKVEDNAEIREELLRDARIRDEFVEATLRRAAVFGDPGPIAALYFDTSRPN